MLLKQSRCLSFSLKKKVWALWISKCVRFCVCHQSEITWKRNTYYIYIYTSLPTHHVYTHILNCVPQSTAPQKLLRNEQVTWFATLVCQQQHYGRCLIINSVILRIHGQHPLQHQTSCHFKSCAMRIIFTCIKLEKKAQQMDATRADKKSQNTVEKTIFLLPFRAVLGDSGESIKHFILVDVARNMLTWSSTVVYWVWW